MELKPTARGFLSGEFIDAYGEQCSIQESSNAKAPHIWLGMDNVRALVCIRGEGWQDVTPPGASILARMHLNQETAAMLIPLLQHFVATGELPNP